MLGRQREGVNSMQENNANGSVRQVCSWDASLCSFKHMVVCLKDAYKTLLDDTRLWI